MIKDRSSLSACTTFADTDAAVAAAAAAESANVAAVRVPKRCCPAKAAARASADAVMTM